MVEGNFEFRCSEMLQNQRTQWVFDKIYSPWLRKILNFHVLKCSRMNDFNNFFHEENDTFTHHASRSIHAITQKNKAFHAITQKFEVFHASRKQVVSRNHAEIKGFSRNHAEIKGFSRNHAEKNGLSRNHAEKNGLSRNHANLWGGLYDEEDKVRHTRLVSCIAF